MSRPATLKAFSAPCPRSRQPSSACSPASGYAPPTPSYAKPAPSQSPALSASCSAASGTSPSLSTRDSGPAPTCCLLVASAFCSSRSPSGSLTYAAQNKAIRKLAHAQASSRLCSSSVPMRSRPTSSPNCWPRRSTTSAPALASTCSRLSTAPFTA